MNSQLVGTALQSGSRAPHYFNGRLLSAEDLTDERAAQFEAQRRLGQGLGAGVVWGLEVRENAAESTAGRPVVTISAGLGINRDGQAVKLVADANFDLPLTKEQAAMPSGDLFRPCCQATPGAFITGEGVYVLLMHPFVSREGSAPVTGLGNVDAPCNSKYLVEGVGFCIRKLPFTPAELDDTAHLRNRAAYRCFGVEDSRLLTFLANPFGPPVEDYGVLDFTGSCQVPLALIAINPDASSPPASPIQFIDLWSARRRPVPRAASGQWDPLAGDRRLAEGEAAFFQFQDQANALRRVGDDLSAVSAERDFLFLPAAGILPVGGKRFSADAFFKDWTTITKVDADSAFLRELLHESFYVEPIEIADPPPVTVFRFAGRAGYVLFMRGEKAQPVSTPPVDTPPPRPKTGEFIILVAGPKGEPVAPDDIKEVVAASDDGKLRRAAVRINLPTDRGTRRQLLELLRELSGGSFDPFDLEFVVASRSAAKATPSDILRRYAIYHAVDLPAGPYHIQARARGYGAGSEGALLAAGERGVTGVQLRKKRPDKPGKPPVGGIVINRPDLVDGRGNRWEKIFIRDRLVPKPIDPDEGFTDPPRDLKTRLDDALQDLLDANPEGLFTPRTAGLIIQPDYAVNKIFDEPYAFLVTTDGARFPMLLVAQDHFLPGSVSPAAAEVPDLGAPATLQRFSSQGLNELDLIASADSGTLAESPGITPEIARSQIADARAGVPTARRNLAHYPGMTPALAGKLREAGFDDIGLANATVQRLGDIDPSLSGAFGERVIATARGLVPRDAWLITAPALGFSAGELDGLRNNGFGSQGDILRATAIAGVNTVRVAAMQDSINNLRSTLRAEIAPRVSLTAVPNVDPGLAENMVAAGITSAAGLANSDSNTLATRLHISPAQAGSLIKDATSLSVMTSLSLTADETVKVIGGASNLGAVSTVPTAIGTSLNISTGERPEVIAGVIANLDRRRVSLERIR